MWEIPSLSDLDISECQKLISVPAGGLYRFTRLRESCIGPLLDILDFETFQLIFSSIQQLLSFHRFYLYGRLHWDYLP